MSDTDNNEQKLSDNIKTTVLKTTVLKSNSEEVTPLLKQINKIEKRNMNRDEKESSNPPKIDKLFSDLFSSVLRGVGSKGNLEPIDCDIKKNVSRAISDESSHSDESKDESEQSDGSDCSDGSVHESEDEDEESDYESRKLHIMRWKALNKLLESHVNLTRSMESLITDCDE